MVGLRFVLSVTLFVTSLNIYREQITIPSCEIVVPANSNANVDAVAAMADANHDPLDLTAILVSNLLLLGSDSSFFDFFFTDFFLSKFLSKSYEALKPDMLLVLGDVSAGGYQLTRNKWPSVLRQFERILGPYLHLPFHVTLGDRDIGQCDKLMASAMHRITSAFPELDSAGCGSFEIGNVSFVSLNTLGLLCGSNELLSDIEGVIERESAYLRMKTEEKQEQIVESKVPETSYEYRWRENSAASQSGPVLLLHFPMHQISERYCRQGSGKTTIFNSLTGGLKLLKNRRPAISEPYDLVHSLPPNATEYIFQALKPRIIFSGHNHKICDITHPDGTREVNVPALTWTVKEGPGFVVATFRRNQVVTVRHCSFPRECHILVACLFIFVFSILTALVTNL